MLRNYFFLTFFCFIFACSTENHQKTKPNKTKVKIEVPTFNADSAYYFIEKQVNFGPRALSSKGWENCAVWLEGKLKSYATDVIVQKAPITTYDGKSHTLKNIIASCSRSSPTHTSTRTISC